MAHFDRHLLDETYPGEKDNKKSLENPNPKKNQGLVASWIEHISGTNKRHSQNEKPPTEKPRSK